MDAEDAAQASRRLGQARSLLRSRRAGTLPQGRSERPGPRARRRTLRAGYQGQRNCRARTRLHEVAEVSIRAAEGSMKHHSIRTSAQWNKTRVSSTLGIDYPIIQGPLGGLSTQRLTATVSNFGGLGSFGAHSLSPSAIKNVIAEIRSLTAKPFAMNLWVSMQDDRARRSDENAFNRSLAPLAVHLAALG